MSKLYRMKWNRKENPKIWFYGPVLYMTTRRPKPFLRTLRPYTLQEAMAAAKYFNKHYPRGIHKVEEVVVDGQDNLPKGTAEGLAEEAA